MNDLKELLDYVSCSVIEAMGEMSPGNLGGNASVGGEVGHGLISRTQKPVARK